jgi:PQQ enzyme repeat
MKPLFTPSRAHSVCLLPGIYLQRTFMRHKVTLFLLVMLYLFSWRLVAEAQVNVTTYKYDSARTGQNTHEKILTPSNVGSDKFRRRFKVSVDGYVYAQPLYVANVDNISGGRHNVLYVATEHYSIYALDADDGSVLWQKRLLDFLDPATHPKTISSHDDLNDCQDLVPEVGITGTPAIDLSTSTLYFVAKSKEDAGFRQRLFAISLVDGSNKFGSPVIIHASVQGSGGSRALGGQAFDPLTQHNRSALLLSGGSVIIAWASHCDSGPYHGWVMSYNASTLAQETVFNTTPNGSEGGVWMSGDGVAADASGNLYLATGNGTYDGLKGGDFGDSILRLDFKSTGQYVLKDWFTPFDQDDLNQNDEDLGSGGILLLPDLPVGAAHQHLLVQMGKRGTMYLIDRDNMGHFCDGCSGDNQIVQEIPKALKGMWGSPAYWNGHVYWVSGRPRDYLKAWTFNAGGQGRLSALPSSTSDRQFGFSTASPVISADDNTNGVLWLLDNSAFSSAGSPGPQILYAYDATDLTHLLYSSSNAPSDRDQAGGAVKFTSPIVVNGMVYAGGMNSVTAWGLAH